MTAGTVSDWIALVGTGVAGVGGSVMAETSDSMGRDKAIVAKILLVFFVVILMNKDWSSGDKDDAGVKQSAINKLGKENGAIVAASGVIAAAVAFFASRGIVSFQRYKKPADYLALVALAVSGSIYISPSNVISQ